MVNDLKKVLERYLNEQFDIENSSLDFSCTKIEQSVNKDKSLVGSFVIKSNNGKPVEGYLYSSSIRMQFQNNLFAGEEYEVVYQFDAKGMEEGATEKGEIYVVSESGEYYLPFAITVSRTYIESSLGNIKNLFHFTNLAKTNWKEAVQLFYSNKFSKILTGNDRQFFSIYKGLVKDFGNEQNVEEFLNQINKKQRIEYLLDKEKLSIENPQDVIEEKIGIIKNGWGYVSMHVFVEGDFLTTEKEYLMDDDFLGNHCNLPIYIYSEKLHKGNNYGAIRLTHAYGEIRFPVEVFCSELERRKDTSKRQLNIALMNCYLDFRMKRVDTASWLAETEDIVAKLIRTNDKYPVYRLYQAQILITQERYNEAKWILDHVKEILQNGNYAPEIVCYYLYLKTLYKREEAYVDKQTEVIVNIYKQNRGNWRIAWLLLYLCEEYNKNVTKKWMLLEELFLYGNCSPAIYIEAALLVNANPALLQKLGKFELQVLNFAVKKEILTSDVIPQIHYLVSREKEFSKPLFSILKYCYELNQDIETVQVICELLMKGNKTGHEYFKWYALGVENQIRVTRLYEYYMMSIDLDYIGELPKIVMMYFAYACNLSYERAAFLYANIMKHRDTLPEMVRSYEEQMKHFIVDQLQKGHINRDLAYLYSELISPLGMSETIARPLAPLLFMHQVETTDENIRQIVVIHDKLKGETRYPVVNGKALISLYSTEYEIFLQDGFGNRYADKNNYVLTKYISPRKMIHSMERLDLGFLGMDLYICENSSDYVNITEETISHFARLICSEQIKEEYKREIRLKVAEYYFENDMIRELDRYLNAMTAQGMDENERAEFVRYMVNRGMYDKAFSWIKEYGIEAIQKKTIFRLCSSLLERNEFSVDEYLLKLSYIAFSFKKYDENILQYLILYYKGPIKELKDIFKAALGFGMDTQLICERIMIQALYSGSFMNDNIEIFEQYLKQGADSEVRDAFLTQCAYEYFVDDKVIDSEVFTHLTNLLQENHEVPKVCKFAYVKHFSENKEQLDALSCQIVKKLVSEMLDRQIYLPLFVQFESFIPKLSIMRDRVILEYKANRKCKVCLHYVFTRDNEEQSSEYRKEELHGIYHRIFEKSFVLFFGESIQYYITEEYEGCEYLTESGTIQNSDMSKEITDSKYTMLNDIAIARTLLDYDTAENMFYELYKKEYLVDNLFQMR